MPHFPSINIRTGGVDKMLNAYKATIGDSNEILTDGKTINWKNVRKIVQFLAGLEEQHIQTEMKSRDRKEKMHYPTETSEQIYKKFDAVPTYERELEKYINPFKENWQSRYYKALFNMDINDTRKKQICVNYLEGLEWTMKYYTTGCADWRWHYKYNYPPLLQDMINYIPYFETTIITPNDYKPVSSLVQLAYVLPNGHYYHYTMVSLMYMLATAGWDCGAGFFKQTLTEPWIHAVVYKSDQPPQNPQAINWHTLVEQNLLPQSAVKSIYAHSALRQQDLVVPWIDGSLLSMAV
jgi:5'-3' exonuclease